MQTTKRKRDSDTPAFVLADVLADIPALPGRDAGMPPLAASGKRKRDGESPEATATKRPGAVAATAATTEKQTNAVESSSKRPATSEKAPKRPAPPRRRRKPQQPQRHAESDSSPDPLKTLDLFEEFAVPFTANDPSTVLPGFWGKLLGFQQRLVRWVISNGTSSYLAFEQGLGKTVMMLFVIVYFQRLYKNMLPICIVCPQKVKAGWKSEFKTFTQLVEYVSVDGVDLGKIVIVTADTAVSRYKQVLERGFQTFVVDEARQYLANPETKFSALIGTLIKKARYRFLLCGTPFDRYVHLWGQMSALKPDFMDFDTYTKRFCGRKLVPKSKGSTEMKWDYSANTNPGELRALLKANGYRYAASAMKDQVGNDAATSWPKPTVTRIELPEASREAVRYYTGMDEPEDVKESLGTDPGFILEYARLSPFKVPDVVAYFAEHPPVGPCLIFFEHSVMADAIEALLFEQGRNFVRIDGKTSEKQANAACAAFQNTKEADVALMSILACRSGINMPRATTVYFTEFSKDFTGDSQARARADRLGQKFSVHLVYLFKPRFSCDEHIMSLIQRKEANVNRIHSR